MKPPLNDLMSRVLDLTRQGQLRDATAAIQAALAGHAQGPTPPARAADGGDVIDIEARVVPEKPATAAAAAQAAPETPTFAQPAAAPHPPQEPAAQPASERESQNADGRGRVIDGSHTERAGTRAYRLYIPPHAEGRVLPLVVMLHGCTQNPDDFARGTRMNEAAEREGCYVLYPEQTREHNAQGCWNWFKHNHQKAGQGEPQILAGMTRAVMAAHAVDPARVYVAGLSAGGAMAAILGDAYPDLYAAVSVHSGLPTGSARDLPSALAAMQGRAGGNARTRPRRPTIVFHGDQDGTVHPVNGERVLHSGANAPDAVQATAGTSADGRGRRYTQRVHRDDQGRVVAEHWLVHGAGHAWSGGSPLGSHADAEGPDATAEMLRFFALHSLPQRPAG